MSEERRPSDWRAGDAEGEKDLQCVNEGQRSEAEPSVTDAKRQTHEDAIGLNPATCLVGRARPGLAETVRELEAPFDGLIRGIKG